MKRSDLETLELSKEQVDAIMKLHGVDVEAHKANLEVAKTASTSIQEQLDAANVTIEGFKKLDPEGIKKASDEWEQKAKTFQSDADQARKDADQKLYDYKFGTRLEKKLKDEFSVKNPKRVIQDLDRSMLKYDDEKDDIIGNLADQIAPIKEKEGYLFSDEKPAPKITTGVQTNNPISNPFQAGFSKGAGIKENENA